MTEAARRLGALAGWRRWAAAALLGALAVLALPPVFAVPVLAVSFTGLVWLLDGLDGSAAAPRKAFAAGWWFGLGHFVGGLYWITNALLVDAERHAWLVPFAVSGLSVYFALFPALACAVASLARAGPQRVLVLAVAWAGAEWLRGILLTGFPWNLVATALAFHPAALQAAALTGAYGLGLVVVAVAAAPAVLSVTGAARRAARAFVGGAFALALVLGAAGAARLALAPGPGAASTEVSVRIVQANIDQRLKWRRELARGHFETYLRLSATPGTPPDAVIWPETALPFAFDGNERLTRALIRGVPAGGVLITGAVRATPPGATPRRLWNAVLAVSAQGIAATYDKHHLVPFGEYVPLRRFLPLTKITAGRIDFTAGHGPRTVRVARLPPFSPLVCYEAIFPGAVTAPGARPAWLLNLTNDAWFGRSSGPHQHLAAARLRAVEEGLPLVRAANTGISAVIDPFGRIMDSLPLGRRGVIDARLPAALDPPPFARLGSLASGGVGALALLLALLLGRVGRAAPVRPESME